MTFIPFANYESVGGPQTFMRNLKVYLDLAGVEYAKDYLKGTRIFFPISCDLRILDFYKEKGLPILQRLDGIYYPSKHGDSYIALNSPIETIYQKYSTKVIFQSEYSKKQVQALFGESKSSTTIVNGVDKSIFYPNDVELVHGASSFRFVTTGNIRNIDMIEPVIRALDELYRHTNFEFFIVGPVKAELLHFIARPYVKYYGPQSLARVGEILRESDIFIYSHLNPPCPNSVLEAVSVGLPIVGFDSGAMSELLFFSRDLLASVSDDVFQVYEDFDYQKLLMKIEFVLNNYAEFRQRSRKYVSEYYFEKCGSQYLREFLF